MKNIKIRTATLCGLIGAIYSLLVTILNVFLPSIGFYYYGDDFVCYVFILLNMISSITLALFFYTLYRNQK